MIVADVLRRVKDITGDEDGTRWNSARLLREVNTAQTEFCKDTRLLRDSVNKVAHSQQSNYNIPNCYMLTRALYNNKPLGIISTVELDKKAALWEVEKGEPTHLVFDSLNRGTLRLYPTPDFIIEPDFTLATANLINITYIRYPEPLLLETDELEIPDIYLETLVLYITGNLFRSDLDSINRQFGAEQITLYRAQVEELKVQSSLDFNYNAEAYTIAYRGAI